MALDIGTLLTVKDKNKLYLIVSQRKTLIVARNLASGNTHVFHKSICALVRDTFIYKTDGTKVTLEKVFDLLSRYYEGKQVPTIEELNSEEMEGDAKKKFMLALVPFKEIIPDHDPDKFMLTHMVKILKWFIHLEEILNTIDL